MDAQNKQEIQTYCPSGLDSAPLILDSHQGAMFQERLTPICSLLCISLASSADWSPWSFVGAQQYVNRELPDVQAGFRKGRGTRDQIANIRWIMEKAREFQRNIYFCFIDYAKAFDCVDHNELWKILKEMGMYMGFSRPASSETYMQVRK